METKKSVGGTAVPAPDPDHMLRFGLARTPYQHLAEYGKPYSGHLFCIANCSLLEYIGVEWSTRIPEAEHLAYMTEIFDKFAAVANDDAAHSAYKILYEVFFLIEYPRRRDVLSRVAHSHNGNVMHPFHPLHRLDEFLRAEVKLEFLEFIRARFWTMPQSIPIEAVKTLNRVSGSKTRTQEVALLETRKAMIRDCAKDWRGTPGDKGDELAFRMLCSMANPYHDGCLLGTWREGDGDKDLKVLRDVVVQSFRTAISEHAYFARGYMNGRYLFDWKYWLTRNIKSEECSELLNVLAKTRAALGGYKEALIDIEAREQMVTQRNQALDVDIPLESSD